WVKPQLGSPVRLPTCAVKLFACHRGCPPGLERDREQAGAGWRSRPGQAGTPPGRTASRQDPVFKLRFQTAAPSSSPSLHAVVRRPRRGRIGMIELWKPGLSRGAVAVLPFGARSTLHLGQSRRQVTARRDRLRPVSGELAEVVTTGVRWGNMSNIAPVCLEGGDIRAKESRENAYR